MGYEQGGPLSIPGRERRNFHFHRVQPGSGDHSTFQPVGTGPLSPRIKRTVCEVDHISAPLHVFMD
jgi:hypothetical protein